MTEIILVRHGQANSDAKDEASYDRLSDLGRQQATWLGAHFRKTNPHFDQVLTGTLARQADTARAMGYDQIKQDKRLNELQYFPMATALETQHGKPFPQSVSDYVHHLPVLMDHWHRDQLEDIPEKFADFNQRITELIREICGAHGRILLVTSGGVIGVIVRHILALDSAATSRIMLQIMNSSMHRLHFVHDQLMLGTFNATPHLDTPDRAYARTFV